MTRSVLSPLGSSGSQPAETVAQPLNPLERIRPSHL